MKQKIEQRYAVITAKSDNEITDKINNFCNRHKVNNVKVTTCDCCRQYRLVNNRASLCYKQCCCNKLALSNDVSVEVEY